MKRPPFIETFTGRRFQPLAPVAADIEIADIAHALSNQCRYSGHTRHFYSVAEHSVRVARCLARWGGSADLQLWGLLHDASEAYLVDLPTPLKSDPAIGDGYRFAERNLMRAVCERFNLDTSEPQPVRAADAVLLRTEVRDLMFGRPEHWKALEDGPGPLDERIIPWSPKAAEDEFLTVFWDLTTKRAA